MYPGKVTDHDVHLLARIAGGIYCQYHNYKVLFEGHDEDKPRYGDIASNALRYLGSALKEHVILQVCKLSDPLRDHRGNENLSIQFFVQHAYFSDSLAKCKLECLGEKLETFGKKLRPTREILYQGYFNATLHIRSAAATTDAAILRGILEERATNPGDPLPLPLPPGCSDA
jgi:hypothetical protein